VEFNTACHNTELWETQKLYAKQALFFTKNTHLSVKRGSTEADSLEGDLRADLP